MEQNETKRIIALIKSAYPKQFEITPGTVAIFHWILGKLDYVLVEKAVYKYCSEPHAFPPAPGILLSYALASTTPKYLDSEEAWCLAWNTARMFGDGGELINARIRETGGNRLINEGRYRANKHLECYPEIVKAIRILGYDTLCQCEEKNQDFLRRRFIEIYESKVDADRVFRQETLIGSSYQQPLGIDQ